MNAQFLFADHMLYLETVKTRAEILKLIRTLIPHPSPLPTCLPRLASIPALNTLTGTIKDFHPLLHPCQGLKLGKVMLVRITRWHPFVSLQPPHPHPSSHQAP